MEEELTEVKDYFKVFEQFLIYNGEQHTLLMD